MSTQPTVNSKDLSTPIGSSKRVIPFTAQHVIYETTLSLDEVKRRLDVEINKDESTDVMKTLRCIPNKEAFNSVVEKYKGNDFLYFTEVNHHVLLKYSDYKTPYGGDWPPNIVYTIGNPIIAQSIIYNNLYAAHSIPPRLLLTTKPDGSGCIVYYQQPSTIMGVPIGETNSELRRTLEGLDAKMEKLAISITAVQAQKDVKRNTRGAISQKKAIADDGDA